jgi:hypothetical protein
MMTTVVKYLTNYHAVFTPNTHRCCWLLDIQSPLYPLHRHTVARAQRGPVQPWRISNKILHRMSVNCLCPIRRRRLCPDQSVKQCPGQHEPTQPLEQSSCPQLDAAPKIPLHAGFSRIMGFLNKPRPNSECIYEGRGDQGEDQVEDESEVGFET